MRVLGSELRPIPFKRGLFAILSCVAAWLLLCVPVLSIFGRPWSDGVPFLAALLVGALSSEAGLSVQNNPKAAIPIVVILVIVLSSLELIGPLLRG